RTRRSRRGKITRRSKAAGEVLTAKQAPHRPGIAPAFGLRAGGRGTVIIAQTTLMKEVLNDVDFFKTGLVAKPLPGPPGESVLPTGPTHRGWVWFRGRAAGRSLPAVRLRQRHRVRGPNR